MPHARSWKDRLGQSQRNAPLDALVDRPRILPKLARLLLALSIAGIIFCGLFPFDLDLRNLSQQIHLRFDTSFSQYFTSGDTVENIFFFMPLGFSLLAVFGKRLRRRAGVQLEVPLGLVLAGVLGLGISIAVELLQCAAIERDPSLTDIVNNTIGSIVGAAIYLFVGEILLIRAARLIERLQRKLGFSALAVITGIFAIAICAAPILFGAESAKLTSWNPSFCLAIGNEINSQRTWIGRVWDLAIASRAASDAEIEQLLNNASPRDVLGDSLLAMYDVRGAAPFADRTGNFPPLELASRAATQPTTAPLRLLPPAPTTQHHDLPPAPADAQAWAINPDTWLRTALPVLALSDAIARSSQFTVAFTVATEKSDQSAASRVLTISRGNTERNLTFAQEGNDLIVRVACAATGRNGDAPEFVARDVFGDTRPRRIVATFANSQLRIFVGSMTWAESAKITPEAAIIWSLYPRDFWKFEMGTGEGRIIALIYRAIGFLILGALAAVTVNFLRRSFRERLPIGIGIVLATAVLLEGLLVAIGGHHFSAVTFIACIIFGLIGIAIIGVRKSLPWAV